MADDRSSCSLSSSASADDVDMANVHVRVSRRLYSKTCLRKHAFAFVFRLDRASPRMRMRTGPANPEQGASVDRLCGFVPESTCLI